MKTMRFASMRRIHRLLLTLLRHVKNFSELSETLQKCAGAGKPGALLFFSHLLRPGWQKFVFVLLGVIPLMVEKRQTKSRENSQVNLVYVFSSVFFSPPNIHHLKIVASESPGEGREP